MLLIHRGDLISQAQKNVHLASEEKQHYIFLWYNVKTLKCSLNLILCRSWNISSFHGLTLFFSMFISSFNCGIGVSSACTVYLHVLITILHVVHHHWFCSLVQLCLCLRTHVTRRHKYYIFKKKKFPLIIAQN